MYFLLWLKTMLFPLNKDIDQLLFGRTQKSSFKLGLNPFKVCPRQVDDVFCSCSVFEIVSALGLDITVESSLTCGLSSVILVDVRQR